MTPVCDVDSNVCVGCSSHEHCPETACNLSAGNCFDPASIIHVSGDDLNCPGGNGSESAPYCDLATALINAPAEPLIILHELFQESPYLEDTVIQGTVAIFAAEGEAPKLQGVNNNPAITVAASGTLFMHGVQIDGTNIMVVGFRVNGGDAWLDSSRVGTNGGGITVTGGSLHVANSFIGGDKSDKYRSTSPAAKPILSTRQLSPALDISQCPLHRWSKYQHPQLTHCFSFA
ncbi:MAG: hypothetical protein HC888_07865 [Candidatus Competibacteraceae bacterium]|nr:hypothetical protein [Candidatus Competibacteraceae bacterium]